jgi:hypothetical protein
MTAPEDPNGLREALARAEAERDDWRSQWEEMAELVCEFAAEKAPDALALVGADRDQCLRRALAAEAETTRLKEGMEAAVGALTNVRSLISEAAMTGFNHADGDWPERLFYSQQRTSQVLRTLSPKEHPHG